MAIVTFVITFVVRNMERSRQLAYTMDLSTILTSAAFLIAAKVLLSLNLSYSLRFVNIPVSLRESLQIYNYTQLAKYIPGNIWHFVGKAGFYKKKGMTSKQTQNAIIIETFWLLVSATVIGVGLLLVANVSLLVVIIEKYFLYILIALITFVLLSIFLFLKFKSMLIEFSGYLKNWKLDIDNFILQCLIWILLGLSFSSLLTPGLNQFHLIIFITGIYTIAYTLGFITPFAPGGMGVREAILVLGLDTLFSQADLIMYAGLHRIIYIFVELMMALISSFFTSCVKSQNLAARR